jgi:hypothetical protein
MLHIKLYNCIKIYKFIYTYKWIQNKPSNCFNHLENIGDKCKQKFLLFRYLQAPLKEQLFNKQKYKLCTILEWKIKVEKQERSVQRNKGSDILELGGSEVFTIE